MNKRSFCIGVISDKGNVRSVNEDSVLVKIGENEYGEFGIFAVADGLGGLAKGDVASTIAVNMLKNWWDNMLTTMLKSSYNINIKKLDCMLDDVIKIINDKVINYGSNIGKKVGTTLSLIFIYDNKYIIKHIGDCRIYKVGTKLVKLTEDHSWVAEQIKVGALLEEQARTHPKRNIITRCIGVNKNINIFTASGYASVNDIFMLCSDGLYGDMKERDIASIIKSNKLNVDNAVFNLVNEVKGHGGADNISVILIRQYKENIISKIKKRFVEGDNL